MGVGGRQPGAPACLRTCKAEGRAGLKFAPLPRTVLGPSCSSRPASFLRLLLPDGGDTVHRERRLPGLPRRCSAGSPPACSGSRTTDHGSRRQQAALGKKVRGSRGALRRWERGTEPSRVILRIPAQNCGHYAVFQTAASFLKASLSPGSVASLAGG